METLEEINKHIKLVIKRLKEFETLEYIFKHGVETQEKNRKEATEIFKKLLIRKELLEMQEKIDEEDEFIL